MFSGWHGQSQKKMTGERKKVRLNSDLFHDNGSDIWMKVGLKVKMFRNDIWIL